MYRFQMISHNGDLFNDATVTLSTVEMPRLPGLNVAYPYESCLFSPGDSEVLKRYQSRSEAIAGHVELEKKFKLS